MRLERAELRHIALPLLYPFETSFGLESEKHCVLVRLDCEGVTGWGECVALKGPWYSEETTSTAWHILSEFLIPTILGRDVDTAAALLQMLARVRGNRMARSALEGAFMDALARSRGQSLSHLLGGEREVIESGVSIGIQLSPSALVATVERELAAGYRRAKLKIKPGADIEYVRAVRNAFPDAQLMVDANSAYTLDDAGHLRELDALGLTMVEQPLAHDDILDHARLATQLQTPICLDESIHSAGDARHALDSGSCRIINIKAGRVGGLTEAVRIHDLCRARGVPVWCGGMLETNIGRAHNVALASLPGFTLPGDISASERYFADDIACPGFTVSAQGMLTVPTTPGIGVEVDDQKLERVTQRRLELIA